jgi:hypothetical protein
VLDCRPWYFFKERFKLIITTLFIVNLAIFEYSVALLRPKGMKFFLNFGENYAFVG